VRAPGPGIQRKGNWLVGPRGSVSIVNDCSPHVAFLLFAAVVVAFPAGWRARLAGMALGALLIHLFNTTRILALMEIQNSKPEWFDFAHTYLWQTGTVIALFACFALWLRWFVPSPGRAAQSTPR